KPIASLSFLLGTGYGNLSALRAYGSITTFRGRAEMLQSSSEVYFIYNQDEALENEITAILKLANSHLSARRNEIAHGIVQPYFTPLSDGTMTPSGFVLYPAYYATRKRRLPETIPLTADIKPSYIYSSVEINCFKDQFETLANRVVNI